MTFAAAPVAAAYAPTTINTDRRTEMSKQKKLVALALLGAMALISKPMLAQAAQTASGAGASSTAGLDQDIKMLREDVQSARKAITAENMNLTADEATKFWPIYDQYAAEVAKIGDARVALIKDYAANYDTMTNDQANLFIQRAAAIDQQFTDARSKYVPLFEKAISAKKTALWYQVDRRLDLLINLQLAGNIPVVDTTN
jgi:NAD(P)H-dependent flavin oxidoreductase YrpB (nitropropane dioxygenase family)